MKGHISGVSMSYRPGADKTTPWPVVWQIYINDLGQDSSVLHTLVYETITGGLRSICLVHPGVRDKRWVSEIDLSQPRHETAFWWYHNGPVMSQLTDLIKWPIYMLHLIVTYVHVHTQDKRPMTPTCQTSTHLELCLLYFDVIGV